jgi:predicted PurR-regulated permease PerM
MTGRNNSQSGTRLLVIAASLVIIIVGINHAQPVLAALLVAIFLSLIGTPPLLWLERQRVPSIVAVAIVVLMMITILLVLAAIVGTSIKGFSDALPNYQARLKEQVSAFNDLLTSVRLGGIDKSMLSYVKPESVVKLTTGMLTGLGSVLSDIVLILLTVTFILSEASSFPIKIRSILGDPKQEFSEFTKFVHDIRRYMVIKTLISLANGVLIGIWLYILGVDFPILWGFLAFLLHYIPNIGFIIAAVPALLLTLIQLGAGSAALAAAGYLAVDLVLGNLYENSLMGQRLRLSTLVVFMSLIFWGSLLGVVGMVLCIPLTMTLRFACENNKGTEWLAVLLGPAPPR